MDLRFGSRGINEPRDQPGSCKEKKSYPRQLRPCHTKPRLGVEKRPRFGKTVPRFPLSTPNHVASVAKYWSMAVLGIQRPVSVSSGPLMARVGNLPYVR